MLATAVATGLSRHLGSESVYGLELSSRGIRWELTLEGRTVAEQPRPWLPP